MSVTNQSSQLLAQAAKVWRGEFQRHPDSDLARVADDGLLVYVRGQPGLWA